MQWEVVIGLENHVQLTTNSKIFSGSSIRFGAEPNTQASPVDLALPGVLPVLNRGAVERAIRFGLAVGAKIAPQSVFARKNYFYPDLPKGYQISQFEDPVVQGGTLTFAYEKDGKMVTSTVNLTRAHLEEDAGKSLHEDYAGMSGIDLNRAGTPLLEIVSEPEMRSANEAVAYAKALHSLVMWLGVCDGNMQEGSFRCDVNVSVRPVGQKEFGTRCEIKNLNSFRFMEEAIHYEVRRQIELIEDGGKVIQATRLWDPDKKETRSMRTKEDAQDYRYFPDPDLPPLAISPDWIERIKADMPELPAAMRERFVKDYGLPEYDALILTGSQAMANYYEAVVAKAGKENAKAAANWMMGDVSSALNRAEIDIWRFAGRSVAAGPAPETHRRRHDLEQRRQEGVQPDVGSAVGRRAPGRRHHRARRPEADLRHRRAGRHRRRGPGQQREIGRAVPRRQGSGDQRADRPVHEGVQGQGESGADYRAAEEEAGGLTSRFFARCKKPGLAPVFFHPLVSEFKKLSPVTIRRYKNIGISEIRN
jgi:aspartyl-tRNA(Asn)/glutamyl-tRNA(Gln) amidotransferase subunit B